MVINIVTTEDLQAFKEQLLEDIRKMLSERQPSHPQRWLKSHQVRRLLTISPGTLQHLRVSGVLPFTKIGGVLYYDSQDIEKMLQERKQNTEALESKNQLGRR